MKARYNLILGRRKQYPLTIELEVYKGAACRVYIPTGITLDNVRQWDATRQIVLRHSNAAAYNNYFKTMIQKTIEEIQSKVLACVDHKTEIRYKADAQIIQLKVYNQFEDRGNNCSVDNVISPWTR